MDEVQYRKELEGLEEYRSLTVKRFREHKIDSTTAREALQNIKDSIIKLRRSAKKDGIKFGDEGIPL